MKTTQRGFKMDVDANEPQEVREVFDWHEDNFQFVPNLAKVMSASPATLRSYWHSQLYLQQYGKLSPEESNIVQLSIAVENECNYCTSGHHLAGRIFFNSAEEDLIALRTRSTLNSEKFEALKNFTIEVYKHKGRVTEGVLESFFKAGYTKAQAIEVVTNISVKVLSNYINQLTFNELDEALAPFSGEAVLQ